MPQEVKDTTLGRCFACGEQVTEGNVVESHGEIFDNEDCIPSVWRRDDRNIGGLTAGRRL